jgi:murein DD-endopeptidase MepM/ murein hydrolase activator NlpD
MSRITVCTLSLLLFMASPSDGPVAALLSGGPAVTAPDTAPAALHVGAVPAEPEPVPPEPADPGNQRSLPAGKFSWPLTGAPAVVRAFQAPAHQYGPGHRGVDLAGESGTPVFAAGAGTVVFAGRVADRGVVSIDHAGGLRTTYEPVLPSVTAGDVVTRGQQIGTLQAGHPGCPTITCLHWGARRGTDYLDPLRLLRLGQVRLLPWEGSSAGGGFEHFTSQPQNRPGVQLAHS